MKSITQLNPTCSLRFQYPPPAVMILLPALVCSPCCPSPSLCWSATAASRGLSVYQLKHKYIFRFNKQTNIFRFKRSRTRKKKCKCGSSVTCRCCGQWGHRVPGMVWVVCMDIVSFWHKCLNLSLHLTPDHCKFSTEPDITYKKKVKYTQRLFEFLHSEKILTTMFPGL